MANIIEVDSLTKKFKDLIAVDNISFAVKEGEIFGFLGPNGAGKTTTINILTTLLNPTNGEAKVNNFNVLEDRTRVRASIGLIFQDSSLDEKLTADENLKFHAWLYHVPKDEIAVRIDNMLKMVELESRRKNIVETFSGGMKRRLEIARGLLHYPRVLFLDEPTLGLDPQTRNRIWQYILELRKKHNITMFMTTHYMDEAEFCDRIAIIDEGKLIALDTPENLKDMIGGDIITLKTESNDQAAEQIKKDFNKEIETKDGFLVIYDKEAEKFIPTMLSNLKIKVLSIDVHRPTLNDVFLKLTGKEIREKEASIKDKERNFMKMRRGRMH